MLLSMSATELTKTEVVKSINNLVVLLSERFLVHNAVHRPLRRLLRSCIGDEPEERLDGTRVFGAAGMSNDTERGASSEDIEGDLVDLINWLQPNNRITQVDSIYNQASSPTPSTRITLSELPTKIPTRDTHQFEFLLFSYLLRFVHREGRLGDFARAGLIFLFDIAFLTPGEEGGENLSSGPVNNGPDPLQEARDALGEFILDGDFADVMAAALGAVYSLLPTKLQVPSISSQEMPEENTKNISSGGMHLGSGMGRQEEGDNFPLSTDLHVQTQLDLLLKLFGFLQDIIRRCNSPILHADPNSSAVTVTHVLGGAIAKAILDAIQSSFLDNVLYPSVLECSSHDGSSVAVLTYLDALFSNLDDGPIVDDVLSFLLDTELSDTPMTLPMLDSKRERQETGAMRFVSQVPLKSTEYFASEGRFTLKDLILDNLCSEQPNSVTAALCLLQTLLSDHPNQATRALISYIRDPSATALVRNPIPRSLDLQSPDVSFLPKPVNFTDAHLQEVELYGSLLSRLDPSQTSIEMSPGYMGYLADMQTALESNPLFRLAQILPFMDEEDKDALNNGGKLDNDNPIPIPHKPSPADPLLRAVLFEFEKFLYKTADENVAMTGVLTAVALCPYRGLGGWLLYEKEEAQNTSLQDDDEPSTECCDSDVSSFIHHLPPDDDRDPFVTRSSLDLPVIYQILRLLVKQISLLRTQVPQFDRLLNEAMNIMLDIDQASSVSVFGSPAKGGENLASSLLTRQKGRRSSGLASSIKSFLTPKKKISHHYPTSETLGTPRTPGTTPGSTTPGGVLGTSGTSGTLGTSGTPEPSRTTTPRRLGFGLGLSGFSSTPTKSQSPSPPPPLSPIPSGVVSSSPFSSSAEPAPAPAQSTSTAHSTAPPFMAHYDQTRQTVCLSLRHDDLIEEGVLSSVTGPWGGGGGGGGKTSVGRWRLRHAKRPDLVDQSRLRGGGDDAMEVNDALGEEEEWGGEGEGAGESEQKQQQQQQQVSLSTVLDNCVILEEFLKETVALIVARRMLGIDQVGFI
ncbi:hypothetical protein L804_00399 [Cryptococcus deuterogattii 2001/935-1]|nr:hypothetical protein L804_00399 [Cryptococcus deuterogattii 2001/935-1]